MQFDFSGTFGCLSILDWLLSSFRLYEEAKGFCLCLHLGWNLPSISFSCPMAVAKTSYTMLNRNGESEHPCLVPDLSGKTLRFCPLSMMLAVGLSSMAFIMLRYTPSIPILPSVFTINGYCTLSKAFQHLLI